MSGRRPAGDDPGRETGRHSRSAADVSVRRKGLIVAGAVLVLVLPLAAIAWLTTGPAVLWFTPYRGGTLLSDGGVYYQNRSADCGVATLAMFLERHGGATSPRALARELEVTEEGVALQSMVEVARNSGVPVEALEVSSAAAGRVPLPAVALVEGTHWVLIEERVGEHAVVVDPMFGRVRIERRQLRSIWSGPVLATLPSEVDSSKTLGTTESLQTGQRRSGHQGRR